MIRVLVAEDSVTVRELLVQILQSDPEIQVVGQAKNGVEAVELAERLRPDLITMDVHMPVLDGLEATKEIMVRSPTPIIIVCSSASRRDVELSLNAMRAGALMVMPKPDNPQSTDFDGRQQQLVTMVKAMAQVKVVRRWAPRAAFEHRAAPLPLARTPPARVVAVVASTGGPAALQRLLAELAGDFPAPILVVQHIAHGFVRGLADWLAESCNLHVKVAEHGERLAGHTVFLAPDDRHVGVDQTGRVVVSGAPPVGGFRPSGTFLLESVARVYGEAAAAVIMTGMGNDGVEGLKALKKAGGHVIAQDEASSVVYGMPAEAVRAGLANEVLPIEAIAARLTQLTEGDNDASAHPRG